MKRIAFALGMAASKLAAFTGLYTGGAFGGHLAKTTASGGVASTFSNDIYPLDNQKNLFDRDITGILYAGYGLQWHSFSLAAEGVLQLGYAKFSNEQVNNSLLISTNTAFITSTNVDAHVKCCQGGLDFLPGWSPNETTLLYGRIGIGAAQAALCLDSANIGQTVFGIGALNLHSSDSKTFTTLRAGAGLEQRIGSRLSLRGDYIFTDYGKLSATGFTSGTGSGIIAPVLTLRNTGNYHFYDHALLLGLSYRFYCQEPLCYDPCCTIFAYQGPYLGGVLGGSTLTTSQQGFVSGENLERNSTRHSLMTPSQLYQNQFQGMLFLGYGSSWKWVYLGGEIFASAATNTEIDFTGQTLFDDTSNDTLYITSFDTSVESSTWQYGFDLRPGYLLLPQTLLYARVGVSAAEVKLASNAQLTGNNGTGFTWSLPDKASAATWKPTFRLGLGAEQILSSKLHLRADYIFTNYGLVSFNSRAVGTDSEGDPTFLTNQLSSHLQNNALFLGLTYYFH